VPLEYHGVIAFSDDLLIGFNTSSTEQLRPKRCGFFDKGVEGRPAS